MEIKQHTLEWPLSQGRNKKETETTLRPRKMKAQPTKNLGDTVKTVLREMCVCVCACVRVCVHALTQLLSHIQLFATPWIVACQAPLSMEFSR